MNQNKRPGKGQQTYKKTAPVKSRTAGPSSGKPTQNGQERQRKAGSGAVVPATGGSKLKNYSVQEPSELLPFLLAHVSGEGRNTLKSMLARGQISVDGKSTTAYNFPLQPGQTVQVSKEKIIEETPMIGLSILYEDDDIIVISKDAGLLSIATAQENELTAYRQLMLHVRESHPQNRIFVVHRLDRDTSGVMMFAKREEVQQQLQNAWQEMVKERTYVALVEGQVKKTEDTITSWLKETKTFKMYSSPHPNDGQHAVTRYKVIQSGKHFSLLEVHLETGRKNQIRVHMQDIGHPIASDKKYGAQTKVLNRLGLHASVLEFEHPVSGKIMRFETAIPKAFLKFSHDA